MPTYNFINKKTGKEIELTLSMSEREAFIADNTDFEQVIRQAPAFADPTRVGVRSKPDEGFRDVLKDIKSKHRRSKINTF